MSIITLTPVSPPGPPLRCPLGDTEPTEGGGVGGWQVVQRDQRTSLTDWTGTEPITMTVPCDFDGRPSRSVEAEVIRLRLLGSQTPAGSRPPILRLDGPIRYRHLRWVITGIDWGQQELLPSGERVRQKVGIALLQHVPADLVVQFRTPAEQARGAAPTVPAGAGRVYRVKAGDTLSSIAARQLGDASKWPAIYDGNRTVIGGNPNSLRVGQVLTLP